MRAYSCSTISFGLWGSGRRAASEQLTRIRMITIIEVNPVLSLIMWSDNNYTNGDCRLHTYFWKKIHFCRYGTSGPVWLKKWPLIYMYYLEHVRIWILRMWIHETNSFNQGAQSSNTTGLIHSCSILSALIWVCEFVDLMSLNGRIHILTGPQERQTNCEPMKNNVHKAHRI